MTNYADEIDPYEYDDRETMVSGWTDEEIAEYDAWLADELAYADVDSWPGGPDFDYDPEPPF
jgi:hypothetical protein